MYEGRQIDHGEEAETSLWDNRFGYTDERTCGDCVVNFTNAKTPQVSPQVVVFSNTTTCGGFVRFVVFPNIKSYRFVVFSNIKSYRFVVFSNKRFVRLVVFLGLDLW